MVESSDTQQFASFDEEAQNLIEGGETAKIRPAQTSRWFAETSADILSRIAEAEKRIGQHRNKEFNSTIIEIKNWPPPGPVSLAASCPTQACRLCLMIALGRLPR